MTIDNQALEVLLVPADDIRAMRDLHRQEMDCQIVLDSWLGRGWVDAYQLRIEGQIVGYGLVGGVRADPKNTITEFYILPMHRAAALPLFRQLINVSKAQIVEVQSNDTLLTLMLYDCVTQIESHVILFQAGFTTHLDSVGATFRKVTEADLEAIKAHQLDSDAEWMLEFEGAVVATGGILFHYNIPYGDIYMGVAESFRRRGFGSYLVQELKRMCYAMGRIPAARCNAANVASRGTLQKAGMIPCARVLTGMVAAD